MAEWIGVTLAAVAILVSTWTALRQHGVQVRLAAIEEARRSEELAARSQADLTAFFEPIPGKSERNFVVHNRGPARATNILPTIAAAGEGNTPEIYGLEDTLLPSLDPGGRYSWLALPSMGDARTVDIHLQWEDPSGKKTKELRLNVSG
jgi:hypothetical protein